MEKGNTQTGSKRTDDKYRITITETGPYLVFGRPPLAQQFIMPDEEGSSWDFKEGKKFPTDNEPTALCRCGASKNKPYCDGSHIGHDWDPRLNASTHEQLLSGAVSYEGPSLTLTDNHKFCVFARLCDAQGRVWNLAGQSHDKNAS